ncbi:peptidylprolyl isomerase [Phycisphaera mikurensis]|uniref:peptidylprolyl isomerase n=1 Tax=Phycisphaera mikurensis (strain NBRC 102666 / KCTC 22515 / FYK2301M01) TaxID=1142394 RepID=I0IG63_PHYMF|nr:peptidylprolyl isomerase [Phycisphaera mikurensis]MBB6440366.1 parvulin-like peptidyl-prolyl isomerase [Phycisphaera mikurensis]BAM04251.1 hypothetical protein PSMK_20920 [Phycisphaera mikurensis NBRC 102666]
MTRSRSAPAWIFGLAAVAAASGGCAREGRPPAAAAAAVPAAAAVAFVAAEPVTAAELNDRLVEAAGPAVLEEIALGRLIDAQLRSRGEALAAEDLGAERERLLAALSNDPDAAERLLATLRERRGLGPVRFAALLRRNAGLRKLVAGEVVVDDAAVRRAFERSHGRRYRARLLSVATAAEAQTLRERAVAGEPFATLASEHSTDASRAAGGLLPPIHPDDATFPAAVRSAVQSLAPGEVSNPVALGAGFGYALIRLEEVLPADGALFAEEEAAVRGAVRADLERLRMEQAARALRAEAEVVLLDPRLAASPAER